MNEALEVFYYILNKSFDFLFGAYLFEGVSIGMLGIVGFIFTILLHYLLAVPKLHVADYRPVTTNIMSENIYKDKDTSISQVTISRRKSRWKF